MWKVKYWQAVIDKSPPNVPPVEIDECLGWNMTNGGGRVTTPRQQSWETEFELSSGLWQSLFVCGVSTMSIHLVFWFKLKSIKRGRENWGKSVMVWAPKVGEAGKRKKFKHIFAAILNPDHWCYSNALFSPFGFLFLDPEKCDLKNYTKIIC